MTAKMNRLSLIVLRSFACRLTTVSAALRNLEDMMARCGSELLAQNALTMRVFADADAVVAVDENCPTISFKLREVAVLLCCSKKRQSSDQIDLNSSVAISVQCVLMRHLSCVVGVRSGHAAAVGVRGG